MTLSYLLRQPSASCQICRVPNRDEQLANGPTALRVRMSFETVIFAGVTSSTDFICRRYGGQTTAETRTDILAVNVVGAPMGRIRSVSSSAQWKK